MTVLPLVSLRQAGRKPALPLDLALPDGKTLTLIEIRRAFPGRRYAAVAQYGGQTVFVKLFVGGKAKKRFEEEKTGASLLAEQEIDAPRLLGSGFAPEEEAGWILFEYIFPAQTLAESFTAKNSPEARKHAREHAAAALARLHLKGLWQEDLHPGNLMYLMEEGKKQDGKFFWVDAGSIRAEKPGQPLSHSRALDNYGMFLAQLPIGESVSEERLAEAIDAYRAENPVSAKGWTAATLAKAINRQRQSRLRDWMRKIRRDCGDFVRRETGFCGAFGVMIVRRDEADFLTPLLADPDAFIRQGKIYKDGGAATVARVALHDRVFVIKRCNIKNFRHRLTRCWRESRAWTSWREGNRLSALGVETAKPLAVIEERYFWFTGRAWLILEHLAGENALERLQTPEQTREIEALQSLFAELAAARLSHGDMKGNNLIWRDALSRWALIDLDGMRAHCLAFLFRRARARDCSRFLQNWVEKGAAGELRRRLASFLSPA